MFLDSLKKNIKKIKKSLVLINLSYLKLPVEIYEEIENI